MSFLWQLGTDFGGIERQLGRPFGGPFGGPLEGNWNKQTFKRLLKIQNVPQGLYKSYFLKHLSNIHKLSVLKASFKKVPLMVLVLYDLNNYNLWHKVKGL